jgi:hypothetical protein
MKWLVNPLVQFFIQRFMDQYLHQLLPRSQNIGFESDDDDGCRAKE